MEILPASILTALGQWSYYLDFTTRLLHPREIPGSDHPTIRVCHRSCLHDDARLNLSI